MKCRKCGKEIPDSSIYCVFCGIRIRLNYFNYISEEDIDKDLVLFEFDDDDDEIEVEFNNEFDEEVRKKRFEELEELLFNNKSDDVSDD